MDDPSIYPENDTKDLRDNSNLELSRKRLEEYVVKLVDTEIDKILKNDPKSSPKYTKILQDKYTVANTGGETEDDFLDWVSENGHDILMGNPDIRQEAEDYMSGVFSEEETERSMMGRI